MTALDKIASLIKDRLEEIRIEEARLSAALKALRSEDSGPSEVNCVIQNEQ